MGGGAIAGGIGNSTSDAGFVGGGLDNHAIGDGAVVTGGTGNIASVEGSAVLGGRDNIVISNSQTAMGSRSAISSSPVPMNITPLPVDANNVQLLAVGNGGNAFGEPRHNAFEISYNGHSTVSDVNGPGNLRAAITGSTYVDNVCYAWGHVTIITDPAGPPVVNCDNFGVKSIIQDGVLPSTWIVTLATHAPGGTGGPVGAPVQLATGSVVATVKALSSENACADCIISTSELYNEAGDTKFKVRTCCYAQQGQFGAGFYATAHDFDFVVYGRP